MIVHINGMPGVGKFTVAKILARTLPARLIDNHLIIDLVVNTCGRGKPAYIPMIHELTEIVHKTLIACSASETIIFTNALAKDIPEDEARLDAIRQLAQKMKKPFIPILLHCSEGENTVRLLNPERQNKGKLMDQEDLKNLIANYKIAHPEEHKNALVIDTTKLNPEETADRIARHITSCTFVEI